MCMLGLFYYYDEIRPRYPKAFFEEFYADYKSVLNGKITYFFFVNHYYQKCQIHGAKETSELFEFKHELLAILSCENFIKETLSDPHMTYIKFLNAWRHYDPNSLDKGKEIPSIFSEGEGQQLMNRLVAHGYCEEGSLKWNEKRSTYLMAMFADAISIALGLNSRGRWKIFENVWGKYNFSDLLSKANDSKESEQLLLEVQEVFPDYKKE